MKSNAGWNAPSEAQRKAKANPRPIAGIAVLTLLLPGFLAVLGGCNGAGGGKDPAKSLPGSESGTIWVGEVGSMTGSEATFGISTHNGVSLAIRQINASGGIKGRKLGEILMDDQSQPQEAATAVTKLITQDKVHAILGEVASGRSKAMAPIAQRYKVPMITPSSTNPDVTRMGDYIFRGCFIDPFQGQVMARFARENLKARDVAVLTDIKNDYSVGLTRVFIDTFTRLGGRIGVTQSYSAGDVDFKSQLTDIRASNPDAIYIPGYYTDAGLIARQARDLGIQVPLLGGDGWDSPKLKEIGGKALDGSFISDHYSTDDTHPLTRAFVTKYRETYGSTPDAMAALGYDATLLLADAMRRAKSLDNADVRDAIAATRGFEGAAGTITMDKDRNPIKPAVILGLVHGGEFRYVTTIAPWDASAAPTGADTGASTPEARVEARGEPRGGLSAAPAVGRTRQSRLLEFFQHLVNGISLGSIYALIALGYTMVFGILQLINFAHGDVYMLGAFIGMYTARWFHLAESPSWKALLLTLGAAMAGTAAAGYLIERLAYRPLRRAPRVNVLITAVGVSLFLEFAGQLLFGADPKLFPQVYAPAGEWMISGLRINPLQGVVLGIALSLMIGLQYIIFRTRLGRAMRAVSFSHDLASLMGIPTDRVISFTFMLGSALAGAAGVLVGLIYPRIEPLMGVMPGLKCFVAAVLGGIGNVTGAVVGAMTLGLGEEFVVGYWAPTYRDALAFALLILILLFRPTGLLGSVKTEKV